MFMNKPMFVLHKHRHGINTDICGDNDTDIDIDVENCRHGNRTRDKTDNLNVVYFVCPFLKYPNSLHTIPPLNSIFLPK